MNCSKFPKSELASVLVRGERAMAAPPRRRRRARRGGHALHEGLVLRLIGIRLGSISGLVHLLVRTVAYDNGGCSAVYVRPFMILTITSWSGIVILRDCWGGKAHSIYRHDLLDGISFEPGSP